MLGPERRRDKTIRMVSGYYLARMALSGPDGLWRRRQCVHYGLSASCPVWPNAHCPSSIPSILSQVVGQIVRQTVRMRFLRYGALSGLWFLNEIYTSTSAVAVVDFSIIHYPCKVDVSRITQPHLDRFKTCDVPAVCDALKRNTVMALRADSYMTLSLPKLPDRLAAKHKAEVRSSFRKRGR